MKNKKIIYWISTGLLTALMLFSISMYIFTHEEMSGAFIALGFPVYLIYPLAVAKILGLIAIWTNKSTVIKEWAYAGFFFNFLLALSAHLSIADGEFPGALMALIFLSISYYSWKKVHATA